MCPWWKRWYHQRLRRIDVEVMWPMLREAAATPEEGRVAWDVFLNKPEQEIHWHCACGSPIKELFSALTVTITVVGGRNDD